MERRDTGGGSRILVVEDQDDVRRMLVMALEVEGYVADDAASAAEGLRRLQDRHYRLVLSDYAMPGGTGTWMLHEATRLGLLDGTVALIVTAHPDARDLPPVGVIIKPLELDQFLEQVRRIVGPAAQPPQSARGMVEAVQRSVAPIELVLYISSSSQASLQARRSLEQVLERLDPALVNLRTFDLVREPFAGDEDRIAFTPTLIKRAPLPRTYLLGNLRDPIVIEDLLHACGVEVQRKRD